MPAPVRSGHRVSPALHLRERGEKLRADDRSRMLAEERPVFLPGLGDIFVEDIVERKEHFRRLLQCVIGPIDGEPEDQHEHGADWQADNRMGSPQGPDEYAPFAPAPSCETPHLCDREVAARATSTR